MSTATRIVIAISPNRYGRFAVYHETANPTDPALDIERAFATMDEAQNYAEGVVAGLRACGRMTSVPLVRKNIRN